MCRDIAFTGLSFSSFCQSLSHPPPGQYNNARRGADGKPSSVPAEPVARLKVAIIHLGQPFPAASCVYLGRGRAALFSRFDLHRTGFTRRGPVTGPPVSSYLTLTPLPGPEPGRSGFFALSIGSRRLGVTQRPALRCSDFPRPL